MVIFIERKDLHQTIMGILSFLILPNKHGGSYEEYIFDWHKFLCRISYVCSSVEPTLVFEKNEAGEQIF